MLAEKPLIRSTTLALDGPILSSSSGETVRTTLSCVHAEGDSRITGVNVQTRPEVLDDSRAVN